MSQSLTPELNVARSLRLLLCEALFWYAPALAFLAVYVIAYAVPPAVVWPHLHVVTLVLALFFGARLLASRVLPPRVAFAFSTLFSALLVQSVVGYYLLVLVGLESWGRVITQELLLSYLWQVPDLLQVLDVSPVLAGLAAMLACGGVLVVCALSLRRRDWAPHLACLANRWLSLLLLLSLLLWAGVRLANYLSFASTDLREPVSLTFSSNRLALGASARPGRDLAADQRELEARKRYLANDAAERRNVILIVVDALRPDHMGLYGYARDTTPYLSELQRQNRLRRISGMRSTCSESACGLRSLFSARYGHQVLAQPISLHQVLKLHGYEINLILGGDHTNFYGLRDEYGVVDNFFDGSMARGYYMNDDQYVIDRTRALPKWNGQPVMFQYHLMSAHQLSKRGAAYSRYLPAENYARAEAKQTSERFTNFYDNGVLQCDAVIKQLLTDLDAKGYLENAVVVVTADHGEGLGEHGLFAHGKGMREAMIRVPFVIVDFSGRGRDAFAERASASQTDVSPTILRELKMPIPDTWRGHPLQDKFTRDFVWSEQHPEYAVLDQRDQAHLWKYIFNANTGEEYLFDLRVDPGENANLIGRTPLDRRKALRALLHFPTPPTP